MDVDRRTNAASETEASCGGNAEDKCYSEHVLKNIIEDDVFTLMQIAARWT